MGPVRFEVAEGVGHIVLARPAAANALDLPMAEALGHAVTGVAEDRVRAVLLTGDGRRFCAGGDLAAMDGAGDSQAYLRQLAGAVDQALRQLAALPKPVVAAVQGSVAGAGLAVMLAADVIVAEESTKFLMAYANAGLTPDCGASWLIPRAVGQVRALELALTGRVLTAVEAQEWGLVTEVVEDGAAKDRGIALARSMADGPALALGQARRLLRAAWETDRAASGADETETIARAVANDEARSRIRAFLGG